MPYQILKGAKIPIRVYVDDLSEVDSGAMTQLRNTANLPWVHGVAAMPDVHWGMGACVGSVIVNRGAVSPAVVGVDIGCGMCAIRTPFTAYDLERRGPLKSLRHAFEHSIPVGFAANKTVSKRMAQAFQELGPLSPMGDPFATKAHHQLGSLGGGNHFVEVCLDQDEGVWVMLHSGSRNIGKELASRHIKRAKGLFGDLVKTFGALQIDQDLAALVVGTKDYEAYLRDLFWCQRYAKANRDEMMQRVLRDLSLHVQGEDLGPGMTKFRVDCHHNYIEHQTIDGLPSLVTRKGAVSAKKGEYGIIPGSMGAQSFVVRGKGNPDSYASCSHGAGRSMSRGAAKKTFTVDDLVQQTKGVECRKDLGVLDEIPGAYKDIRKVMSQQNDLVDIIAVLKQVLCVKG